MRTFIRTIDSISDWTGKTIHWLSVAIILVIAFEVIMRYVFVAPTIWVYDTSRMLGAALYILAWPYVHRHRRHVRVDIIYTRLSPRSKAIIDVIGTMLFFFPLVILLIDTSIAWMLRAWLQNEKLVETYWYPPTAPLRTVVTIGLVLFAIQGSAQFFRDLYLLIRNKPYD